MAIRMVEDVAAPLVVAGVNIVSRTAIPAYHDWLVYGMTTLGYIGGWMRWGGDFVKQIGVSSLPLTADKIYERVRGGAAVTKVRTTSNQLNRQRVTRSYEPEFNAVGVI